MRQMKKACKDAGVPFEKENVDQSVDHEGGVN
jgi:hypothetical protein